MSKNIKSIEEQVEDICKKQLSSQKYYTKTESINTEIDTALKETLSKNGGKGGNYPDIKLLIQTKKHRTIPVMIEVKGKIGNFIKLNEFARIDNYKRDGTINFQNVQKFAVNGAVHYGKTDIKSKIFDKNTITIDMFGNAYFRNL